MSICIVSLDVLSYYVYLGTEFHVVLSVTISSSQRCSVRLYSQLFVVGLMSYLRYCVCLRIVVSSTYCFILFLILGGGGVCFVLFCFCWFFMGGGGLRLVYPMLQFL